MNVHALTANRVDTGGRREVLGLDVASTEDGAGYQAFGVNQRDRRDN